MALLDLAAAAKLVHLLALTPVELRSAPIIQRLALLLVDALALAQFVGLAALIELLAPSSLFELALVDRELALLNRLLPLLFELLSTLLLNELAALGRVAARLEERLARRPPGPLRRH